MSLIATAHGREPQFQLNNQPLDVNFWGCVENGLSCEYMYTNFTVSHGLQTLVPLSSDIRFLAWTYGHGAPEAGCCEAYGMITGFEGIKHHFYLSHTFLLFIAPVETCLLV